MGIYYEEQSGKRFKVKLKVSEVRIGKISRVLGLANLLRFANLFHQRKPKYINN